MSEERTGVYLVRWSLLAEWWHVDAGISEAVVLETIRANTQVNATLEQIKQRLFGGFKCSENSGKHVYHATGYYTYSHENGDLPAEDRQRIWGYLLENNQEETIDRTALFTADCSVSV